MLAPLFFMSNPEDDDKGMGKTVIEANHRKVCT